MKVLVNKCYGGFGLSDEALKKLGNLSIGIRSKKFRVSPEVIKVVEEMGLDVAADKYARLVIVEIPDNIDWYIEEYDGFETIREVHRSW